MHIRILIIYMYVHLSYTHMHHNVMCILLCVYITCYIILIHLLYTYSHTGTDYVNEAPEQYFEDMITTCQSIMIQLSSLKDSFLKSSAYLPINKANLHHLTDLTSIDAFRKQGQSYNICYILFTHMYVCMYVCMSACICICMSASMCACICNVHLRICYNLEYITHKIRVHLIHYIYLIHTLHIHYIYALYTGAVGIKEICEDLNGTSSLVDEVDGISVNLPIKWLILGPGEEIVAALGQICTSICIHIIIFTVYIIYCTIYCTHVYI